MTVLLVEDEVRLASFVTKGLSAQVFSVTHVRTGTEALERAQEGGVQLIVLDLGLPDLDGLEVLRRLHDSSREVPVIVLTARSNEEARARSLSLGAADYITKPFAFRDLLTSVRSHVSQSA